MNESPGEMASSNATGIRQSSEKSRNELFAQIQII